MPDAHLRQSFRAYGTSFAIESDDPVALDQAVARARSLKWTPAEADSADVEYLVVRQLAPSLDSSGKPGWDLLCDGTVLRTTSELTALADAFEDHAKNLMAYRAEGCLFVHAGAVSWRKRGIVMPGRSHAGKTTLVRALVEAGARYYSDEFAILDRQGRLLPYTLPLSLRATGPRAAARVSAESLGGQSGVSPVRVALVVVAEYRRYARWRPEPLTPGQALLALMDNAVAARRAPELTMPVLRKTALGARCIKSLRGNARAVAGAILSELG